MISFPRRRNWRSFGALVVLQAQNAFNDNAVRFVLLPLGMALAAALGPAGKFYAHILAAMLVLPYILFSPVAGWLADRFPKNRMILAALWMQTVVFVSIVAAVHHRELWVATFGFFLLALQSTLLSPAKNGIIKELVGPWRLNFANGIVEMTLILGILLGMLAGGLWFNAGFGGCEGTTETRAWAAAAAPLWWLTAATLVALAAGYLVERVPARLPDARFEAGLFWSHFGELRRLLGNRGLRLCAVGVMFFWFFGTLAQLIIVQVAGEATGGLGGMGKATSVMVACASGGVAAGAMLASLIGRRRTELGLIPAGGLLMAASCAVVAVLPPGGPAFHAGLGFVGLSSALFFVPLFAYFQELAPGGERGRLIASSNLMNNLGMVLATLAQMLMIKARVPVGWQFALLGVGALVVAGVVLRLLPDRFFRLMILPFIRAVWQVRGAGRENVPAEGGVLMVSNHVSYLDAFVLSAVAPRPVRFLIYEGYYRRWWCRWFLDIFGAVPIAGGKAHGAIKAAADALRAGHVVCIFPEGKLTTSGEMQAFRAGLEVILRLAPVPVVPVALHGLWGSVFSYHGGRPFSRLPRLRRRRTLVRFGKPMMATAHGRGSGGRGARLAGRAGSAWP